MLSPPHHPVVAAPLGPKGPKEIQADKWAASLQELPESERAGEPNQAWLSTGVSRGEAAAHVLLAEQHADLRDWRDRNEAGQVLASSLLWMPVSERSIQIHLSVCSLF